MWSCRCPISMPCLYFLIAYLRIVSIYLSTTIQVSTQFLKRFADKPVSLNNNYFYSFFLFAYI